jgi:hypothetical protein
MTRLPEGNQRDQRLPLVTVREIDKRGKSNEITIENQKTKRLLERNQLKQRMHTRNCSRQARQPPTARVMSSSDLCTYCSSDN